MSITDPSFSTHRVPKSHRNKQILLTTSTDSQSGRFMFLIRVSSRYPKLSMTPQMTFHVFACEREHVYQICQLSRFFRNMTTAIRAAKVTQILT